MKDTARVLGRMYDAHRVPRLRPGHGRGPGGLRRRAGLQRADRRVAPDPDARRHADHARALRQAAHRRSPSPSSATPATTWATRSSIAGAMMGMDVRMVAPKEHAAARRRAGRSRETLAPRDRRPDHAHRRRRRGREGRRLRLHRRLGLDGRGQGGLGRAHQAAHALPGQRDADGSDRQPDGQVHALPAGLPQHRHQGRQGDGRDSSASPRWRSPTRSSRARANVVFDQAENRHAHDQGDPRRHAWRTEPMARIVVALGGNALLQRGEPMTAENQRANVRHRGRGAGAALRRARAGRSPTATARRSGCWRCRSAAYDRARTYPLDVLGAETEGMIGYMIEQELGNLLPFERPFATLLTMVEVDPRRPGVPGPDQVHRPGLRRGRGEAASPPRRAGQVKPDGDKWRRVVPSPLPKRIFELRPIQWLLEQGHRRHLPPAAAAFRRCTSQGSERQLVGVEVRHRQGPRHRAARRARSAPTSSSCATDVDAVYLDWGKPEQRAIRSATPDARSDVRASPPARWGPRSRRPRTSPAPRRARHHLRPRRRAAAVRGEKGTTVDMATGEMRLRLKQKRPRASSSCVQRALHRGGALPVSPHQTPPPNRPPSPSPRTPI